LLSRLLSRNKTIKIYRIAVFAVVLYGFKTWFFTMGQEHRLRALEYRALKGVLETKRKDVKGGWRQNCIMRSFTIYMQVIKLRKVRWMGHVACNIKMRLTGAGREGVDWTYLVEQMGCCDHSDEPGASTKFGALLD
jgi:hypothetical protein